MEKHPCLAREPMVNIEGVAEENPMAVIGKSYWHIHLIRSKDAYR
jgi:hypothetical protein